jgi:hypothetical protein
MNLNGWPLNPLGVNPCGGEGPGDGGFPGSFPI